MAGFDPTFSAPKSVSVMWAITGEQVWLGAHDAAVGVVLDVLERYGCTTRVGPAGGQAHVDAEGLVAATFRQHTSRSLDPQIHTHCYLSTKVLLDDGRWRALDARWLKQQQQAALGYLYQHALRSEITTRTGLTWGPVVNGCAELGHLPTQVLKAYSTRTGHVDTLVAQRVAAFRDEHGVDPTQYQIWGSPGTLRSPPAPRKRMTPHWDSTSSKPNGGHESPGWGYGSKTSTVPVSLTSSSRSSASTWTSMGGASPPPPERVESGGSRSVRLKRSCRCASRGAAARF